MKVVKTVEKTNDENRIEELTVFTPKVYDFLKKLVLIWLPAFSVFYLTIGQIWGLPEPEKVVATISAIATLLGVMIGISANRYNNSDAGTVGEFVVSEDGGGAAGYRLVLNADPEQLANQEKITFKVQKVQA